MQPILVFTYGILKNRGVLIHERYKLNASMYDLGPFPAITELGTNRQAVGNIIAIDPSTLETFDRIEGINPEAPTDGLYRRETIATPYGPCFIYVYNGEVSKAVPISEWTDSAPIEYRWH